MIRAVSVLLVCTVMPAISAKAQPPGREIYMQYCFWCHGEQGRGDGPAAVGMFPLPRDFVRADYRIRSTPHGQLPTDEDLHRAITRGLPGTPMPGWKDFLTVEQIGQLVEYLKSFSPRFSAKEATPPSLKAPTGTGSAQRGEEIYRKAKCFMCHGESGRGDGGITSALNYQWGLPYPARDLTRGWTFRGGHEPSDIYLRITTGLNGTPMGPYQELLDDQERWDLAHYVASLDVEPTEAGDDFVVSAAHVAGEIPEDHEDAQWQKAHAISVPLGGQVVLDPPTRWWTPTATTATVRALCNEEQIGFLVQWDDPTGPDTPLADSALLQFATDDQSKPYFLLGNAGSPVRGWHWRAGNTVEQFTAEGPGTTKIESADFQVSSSWSKGRWHVIFRRPLAGEPAFASGSFVPVLFSLCDGGNGESGNVRAISTWVYATLEPPASFRPWLLALAFALGAVIVEIWILRKVAQSPSKQ